MADAARAARGSFNDIKSGAGEMGRSTSGSMMEARHGVMLLGEEFGVHLPRALTTFIASLGPIGAAMETAFPFLAIIVGATLLLEHLAKLKEEGEKLTESQRNFGAVTANVLNDLDQKLLQAGIQADELNGNHLAALEKQLQLIDHQSLKELEKSFEELEKSSDAVMAQLKTSWYQFGAGSDGAKHALEDFKQKYDLLLAQGKNKEASDLLAGTLKSAERILALQEQARANQLSNTESRGREADAEAYKKFVEANMQLTAAGTDHSEKAVTAQKTLVEALQAQVAAETKIVDLKKMQDANARQSTQKAVGADEDKLARMQADNFRKETDEQDKLDAERYQQAVENIQQGEREKIAATREGSAARLAAIDEAIKDENAKGLQETGFYKELLTQRVNTQRQMAEEQKKLSADAAKEQADHTLKMGELQIAAAREQQAVLLETKKKGNDAIIQSDLELAEQEYRVKLKGYEDDIAALDKSAADYQNKLQALQDREAELTKAHENEITRIKDDAEKQREKTITSAERRLTDEIARGLSDTLLRHRSFAAMMGGIGDEIAAGMLQTAIKSAMLEDFGKEREAAHAARMMFLAGLKFPFPANIVMAPTLAAGAFAAVMAFQEGGLVPGVGLGDIVPAKLEPGETVLPKQMTERLNKAADSDGGSTRPVQVHFRPTYHVNTIDGDGIRSTLNKHSTEFQKHVEHTLRKMNR